jgi:hypothetical protein
MEQIVFKLSDVPDRDSKITRLAAYPEIKRQLFSIVPQAENGKINITKFYREVVAPNVPEGINIDHNDVRRWYQTMMRYLVPLITQVKAQQVVRQEKTLLDREHEKLVQQAEIRQDVTGLMADYIHRLKAFVSDNEKMSKLTHKEMLELYKVIREEEDRNKTVSLKERSENRADLQFAFFVSQARAGQLIEADIEFLEASIKEDLQFLKAGDGTYQLPVRIIPKIQLATEDTAG